MLFYSALLICVAKSACPGVVFGQKHYWEIQKYWNKNNDVLMALESSYNVKGDA